MQARTDPNNEPGMEQLWPLVLLAVVCVAIECVLTAADWGFLEAPSLRRRVVENFGFWPGLLRGWTPNYDTQPYLMFFSYSFLHGGLWHLAVNMITLWSLGRAVIARVSPVGFALVYAASTLGGAVFFGVLAPTLQPMVGASGALFGLAGAVLAWNYVDRYSGRQRLWPVARAVIMLIALNVVLWWAMAGQLAWETHLGGFVAGWFMAMLVDPRGQDLAPPPDQNWPDQD